MTDETSDSGAAQEASAPEAALSHPIQLLLLRHADAGDPAGWTDDDALRPLSGKGRRQARLVGRWLARRRRMPDVVITSPKVRATQTAALASHAWRGEPLVDERLAADLGIEDLARLVSERATTARRVLLVGHDPDFSNLASLLVGASIAIPKGALARIDVADRIGRGAGVLRWLVPAEALVEE